MEIIEFSKIEKVPAGCGNALFSGKVDFAYTDSRRTFIYFRKLSYLGYVMRNIKYGSGIAGVVYFKKKTFSTSKLMTMTYLLYSLIY